MSYYTFKDDGSEWYNYFFIRKDDFMGYYFAWIGSKRIVFPDTYFKCTTNARNWIKEQNWRAVVDEEFEKEVLGVKEES